VVEEQVDRLLNQHQQELDQQEMHQVLLVSLLVVD
tara:strand:+ start:264 stop:368 length:105 start_codon:yes stop_codon:yes gene_type:complete